MKFILKVALLSLISILTIGIQTSYAGCMRISAVSCNLNPDVNPASVLRVGGFIKHAGNYTNTIKLVCPVNLNDVKKQVVEDFYLYSEDKYVHPLDALYGDKYQPNNIYAQLRTVNYYGNISTLLRVDGKDGLQRRTGQWGENGYHRSSDFYPTRTMNFAESSYSRIDKGNFYYVDVYIKRPKLDEHPAFAGISFCGETTR